MDEIVSLSKRRGFVYQTSEIYGGLANGYDYGPLGVELLRKIKNLWWDRMIRQKRDMIGIDSQIILHPKTWEASGHVGGFADLVVEDTVTHKRYRADHLVEQWMKKNTQEEAIEVEDFNQEELAEFIHEHKILSPDGNPISEPKQFDLLMKSQLGTLIDDKDTVYLRGETAQGIFSNFKNILDTTRVKLPFGVGQIGKSFRNEITLGQYVFRTFEFEQGEIEYFFDPEAQDPKKTLDDWKNRMWDFVVSDLGIDPKKLRWRRHTDKERSHYSKDTYDLDYQFPFGWKELWGIAYRTDYDLSAQMKYSGADLRYTDPYTQKKFVPHVIEPAVGINRLFFMVLCDAFQKEEDRTVLAIKPTLAPYEVAVFPLVSNKEELIAYAEKVFSSLSDIVHTYWDDRGNIGKRYKYQDEIGTPFCVTIDYDTLESHVVTVRNRDTMKQEKVAVDKLPDYISQRVK